MAQACLLVKALGLVPSFRNLYVIELAIRSESQFAEISLQEARDRIVEEARFAIKGGWSVDYFWFEDCRWRNPKLTFKEQEQWRMRLRNPY